MTVDADWNEQASILLNYLRTLATDIIGPYGGPTENCGFQLGYDTTDGLTISQGRYYVNGVLAENNLTDCTYVTQPYFTPPSGDPLLTELGLSAHTSNQYWVYLDVWERHITYLQDPNIREVALNGPDTCTRAMVVWQVKCLPYVTPDNNYVNRANLAQAPAAQASAASAARASAASAQASAASASAAQASAAQAASSSSSAPAQASASAAQAAAPPANAQPADFESNFECSNQLSQLQALSTGLMSAQLDPGPPDDGPCVLPPSSKYRGPENQLYRVEVHVGGASGTATFKWSRDNGSVVTAVLGISGNSLTVSQTRGFEAGNWVELLDDNFDLADQPGTLVKLQQAGNGTLTVDTSSLGGSTLANIYGGLDTSANPIARRWDQTDTDAAPLVNGAVPITDSSGSTTTWIDLEDGIQVSFQAGPDAGEGFIEYRTGDYWLIPARVATGDIEWPTESGTPVAMSPLGIEHYYAPLGIVSWPSGNFTPTDCTCTFSPINSCYDAVAVHRDEVNPAEFQAREVQEDMVAQATQVAQVKRAAKATANAQQAKP